MSNTQHTPGPWLHRGKSESVHKPSSTHPFGEFIFKFDDEQAPNDADLNLILAAPDLLGALQELLGCDKTQTSFGAVMRARAAIAKATGGAV